MNIYSRFCIPLLSLFSSSAIAHDNHMTQTAAIHMDFISGVLHPLSGFDHLLALLLVAALLLQSRLPLLRSLTAIVILMTTGAIGGLLTGSQAWLESAMFISLVVMFILLWLKADHIQTFIFAACSIAVIAQGWAHGAAIYSADISALHSLEFISGTIVSSLVLLWACILTAGLIAHKRRLSHAA